MGLQVRGQTFSNKKGELLAFVREDFLPADPPHEFVSKSLPYSTCPSSTFFRFLFATGFARIS
jgi:hypothetical protein